MIVFLLCSITGVVLWYVFDTPVGHFTRSPPANTAGACHACALLNTTTNAVNRHQSQYYYFNECVSTTFQMEKYVDDLWGELQADTVVSTKSSTKSQKLLNKLLGGTAIKKKKQIVHEFKIPVLGCTSSSSRSSKLTAAATPVVSTQVLKYAGQEYSVTKKAAASGARESALDAALASLNQPKKVSTIEKSSLDWDSFKDEAGIVDELDQYTKDGYLEKQDFLHRVDARKFELEKAVRDKQRKPHTS
ncbi:hypothetical protein B5M09_002147 [Aphanomyces astaci]|uniref:BCNT-C domain-containing protein n=1 Tax=Aphanomyces astaci TaxID=112090 RepID=A0A425DG67_APHAT|nr:hypothetical protein B5M09_002147 [Aphanomyces astaci]